jgi:GTP cyclohydrolase II
MKFENLEKAVKYSKTVNDIVRDFDIIDRLEEENFKKRDCDSKAKVRITFEHYGRDDSPLLKVDDDKLARDLLSYAKSKLQKQFDEITEKVKEL